jgi:PhnB protein
MDNAMRDEQLDRVIQSALAAGPTARFADGAALDPAVTALVGVAEKLRSLPREDFKSQLKTTLMRSSTMAAPSTAQAVSGKQSAAAPYRTVTPYLTAPNASELIDFVERAFDAVITEKVTTPSGGLHGEVRIGNSMLMIGGGSGGGPWFSTAIHLKVDAVDQVYARALEAGATSLHAPREFDYGERGASVKDMSGNLWYIATPHAQTHWLPEMSDATIYLHPQDSAAVIDFAKRAFGAEEIMREASGGVTHHAKIRVGDSIIEMGDADNESRPMPTMFYVYLADRAAVNSWYSQAVSAGATSLGAPARAPYGDFVGSVSDPFGNQWYIASPSSRRDATHDASSQSAAEAAPKSASAAQPDATAVSFIRKGFRTLTPYLLVTDGVAEMEFLKQGLGAVEIFRVARPGKDEVMHAEVRIGDAVVEFAQANAEFPHRAAANILYVDDVDEAYSRALGGGATSVYGPTDQPYGDRDCVLTDPGGAVWCLSNRGAGAHITPDTPSLVPIFSARGADNYIEFLTRAFSAEVAFIHKNPEGIVEHARLRLGNSVIAIGEDRGRDKAAPFLVHIYIPNVDAVYASALAAGATSVRGLEDAPYGDRTATVSDPFGNLWSLATHVRDAKF